MAQLLPLSAVRELRRLNGRLSRAQRASKRRPGDGVRGQRRETDQAQRIETTLKIPYLCHRSTKRITAPVKRLGDPVWQRRQIDAEDR
jgi:hypothetical protein